MSRIIAPSQLGRGVFASAGKPRLQLSVHGSGRYLVDGTGTPFQIRGSSTWCIVQLSQADIVTVLDNTKAKRFNSIVIMSALSSNANSQYGPAQFYGYSPFTDSKLTPSEPFWAHLDFIIDQAAQRGLVVQLAFLYLGHASAADGFQSRVAGCTSGECQAFGEFLGARYRNRPNLIWICGGDNLTNWESNWNAMIAGLLSRDTNHLVSGHPARAQEGRQFGSFITLNSSYRALTEIASGTLTAYQGSPTLPVFLFEGQYEGDGSPFSNPTLTAAQTRIQSWQAMLSGGCGANFGNHPVWTCGYVNGSNVYPNWLTSEGLDSLGHQHMAHLHDFFERIRWWDLVPDANSTFVTAGRSSAENYVAAASSSTLGVAVIPAGGQITIDMSTRGGAQSLCRYFDPTAGTYSTIGTFSNSSTRNFDPSSNAAGDADMVLLLEAA